MKRLLILSLLFSVALGVGSVWAQCCSMAAAEEKAPQMMPKMQEDLKEMQQILGHEKITPEQRKKMQGMVTEMQGMMTQMHEKMTTMPKEKMEMCPMMQKMKDQAATVKSLEERVDKLEKAVKSK